MLAIMLIVGRPDPPARPAAATAPSAVPSADRVRDYQDRLRALEAQALRDVQVTGPAPQAGPLRYEEPASTPPQDPIETERKRREYESLFASNVALSRRPDADRPDVGRPVSNSPATSRNDTLNPSVDEIADAVLRATTRASGLPPTASGVGPQTTGMSGSAATAAQTGQDKTPAQTDPISPSGPLHRLLEGTVIDTVLTNRLDGSSASPVNCLVTNAVYSHSGRHVVIPAGARVLGQTSPVQGFGEARLAVAFHRLLMPDGRTYRLDRFLGLNQIGDAGLRDRVNHHYLSTFGAAAAVGLISGLSQYLGSAGLAQGDGDRTIVIAGGVGDATSQATLQVMSRFLNRLPTITIREGHRVKVYLTGDLELPAYTAPSGVGRF
jgi:type IV secretion system protein VirB10